MKAGRDVWWHEALDAERPYCPAEVGVAVRLLLWVMRDSSKHTRAHAYIHTKSVGHGRGGHSVHALHLWLHGQAEGHPAQHW